MFCDYIRDHLTQHNLKPPYNEFFYMPSRRTEGRLSCDMSIGLYETEFRVRTMHKMLLYQYGWCDWAWSWDISVMLNKKKVPTGDYAHLLTLLDAYNDHPDNICPYLVLHHYYCVHDFRRLDAKFEDWTIPGFKSPLRTIIIDLSSICKQIDDWKSVVSKPTFKLAISKEAPPQAEGEPAADYLKRISKLEHYKVSVQPGNVTLKDVVVSLDQFCSVLQGYFANKWVRA